MARIARIIDDLTGVELHEDVEPTTITFDGQDYELDLGDASKERLVQWLKGEGSLTPTAPRGTTATKRSNSAENAKVRAWAQSTGYKYKGADGKDRTLGDRGAIPEVVVQAWKDAGRP